MNGISGRKYRKKVLMDWLKAINEIKRAQENNRLVVFVGAGVSKNSNMPSWGELVAHIAKKVGYRAEILNRLESEGYDKDLPKVENWFTQDEYLRIPEYFYQTDKSFEHKDYYQLIQSSLSSKCTSNSIDSEVFNLLPHHIITTNYDSLLEKASNPFTQLYTVVSEDKELLSKPSDRYIIKMHGDLNIPTSIVLKESDYINYEQKHPLISTFIKSLLVNHTFMFVGYSLNDYNLNLIIGWINYFQKHYEITERPKSFLIDTKAPLYHERIRQESRNIFVINIADLPEEITDSIKVPEDLTAIQGKQLFSFLRIITDEDVLAKVTPFEEILKDKFSVFDSYNKIAYDDLINTQDFGPVLFRNTVMSFYRYEDYRRLDEVIKNGNPKIIDVFQRAGISSIDCMVKDEENTVIPAISENDSVFLLCLENDYKAIKQRIEDIADPNERIYYLKLIGSDFETIYRAAEESEKKLNNQDFISILMSKIRFRLALLPDREREKILRKEITQLFRTVPIRYQNATVFIRMLFESMSAKESEMQKILDKQEKRNEYGSHTWSSGHAFVYIWQLQSMAYNYYFFIKKNYLPIDYYSDPKRFLKYYVQAILCSYMPVDSYSGKDLFGESTHHEHYILNIVDFDILIKFVDTKELDSWLKKYSVRILKFEENVDVVLSFKNLCESFNEVGNIDWKTPLLNYSRVLCLANLDGESKRQVLISIVNTFDNMMTKPVGFIEAIFEVLDYYFNNCSLNEADDIKRRLLQLLLQNKVMDALRDSYERKLFRIINQLKTLVTNDLKTELMKCIDSIPDNKKRVNEIYMFRSILPMDNYRNWLEHNIEDIRIDKLFGFVIAKIISFTDTVQERFISTIRSEVDKRINVPGMRSYPDWLSNTIDWCIILKLAGIPFDISLLEEFAEYSTCLQFVLAPTEFDYSQVDTRNYMWHNLMYSNDYGKYFKINKETILNDELRLILKRGFATEEQQKVVYGLLLDKDELRGY